MMEFEDINQIPLSDGSMGEFKLSYSADLAVGGPWLKKAERHVRTRIGDDMRHSHEVWTMQTS